MTPRLLLALVVAGALAWALLAPRVPGPHAGPHGVPRALAALEADSRRLDALDDISRRMGVDLYYALANRYRGTGRSADAEKALRKALAVDPGNIEKQLVLTAVWRRHIRASRAAKRRAPAAFASRGGTSSGSMITSTTAGWSLAMARERAGPISPGPRFSASPVARARRIC